MSSEEIFEKVKGIIVEQLGVSETAVTMEASFIDDLGADSLDIVELVMALEEEFDIEIPDADAEKVATVGDVVEYIKENVKKKMPKGTTQFFLASCYVYWGTPFTCHCVKERDTSVVEKGRRNGGGERG